MTDPRTGWLTIDEAAALIRVKKSWLYERTRMNTVPHLKLGEYLRFNQDELLRWVRQFHHDGRGRGARHGHSVVRKPRGTQTRGRPLG
jgi:excisionase family DNA binding protein